LEQGSVTPDRRFLPAGSCDRPATFTTFFEETDAMQSRTPIVAGITALCACISLQAQVPHRLPDPVELFEQADTNHDGVVSRDEYMAARARAFDDLDRNHDRFLTEADFPRLAKAGERGDKVRKMLAAADADHDGRVSRDEFRNAGGKWFDLADANHDGVVDKDELKQAAERFKALRER
jgi:Ca2+-binding EF-hand superfamily protein